MNKEIKIKRKRKNEATKIKSTKVENAFWLSSFIAIFIPCCYTKPIQIATITAVEHDVKLRRKLGKFVLLFKINHQICQISIEKVIEEKF